MSGDRFQNEPLTELRRPPAFRAFGAALTELDERLPVRAPALIGDQRLDGDGLTSTDPGSPDRVVSISPLCGPEEARGAVAVAAEAHPGWRAVPAAERAARLLAAAEVLRRRRPGLAAMEVRDAAKPWEEADADVAEAIDHITYAAHSALELERGPELIQLPGERNAIAYRGRGPVVAITPWNFPLAIPAGIVGAALAAGNAVVLKPAEQAPLLGLALVEALREGGVPAGAASYLPGAGEAGAALVEDPRVATIGFTGSSAVGLEVVESAGRRREGQAQIKRVVAEMGGKNAVIVDSDADLDEAVPGIVRSAFAYAGQKCSACSLVLAHEAIAERLLERLAGAVEALTVGQAEELPTDVPPLIERAAQERVGRYAELAERQGSVAARAGVPSADGWFAAPTVVADLPGDSAVAREEVFGPLLAFERVESVDAALERVGSLPFALTGGVFCRNPATVERVARDTPVGNLYVNRSITGARVGRQPFGGNRLSGAGLKAGGPHYLLQFADSHAVSENTMRHGLVPELED